MSDLWSPAPWSARKEVSGWNIDGNRSMDLYIARVFTGARPDKQSEANARLIAAAPELYAALAQLFHEAIAAGFESADDYNWPKSISDAKAALAKARGEP